MTHVAQVDLDSRQARRLGDALAELLDSAITAVAIFERADGRWAVDITFAHSPDESLIRRAVRDIAGEDAANRLAFTTIATRDWVAASLSGLTPVAAGRFLVHGAHDRHRAAAPRIAIEIEAALAFGTGHHGTTRGCLLALDRLAKARRPQCILDIGTGTGVLAIAAAKALRRPVLASDIDRRAVVVARENARLNHAASAIEVVHAHGLAARRVRQRAPFDLVFANILLAPLKLLAAPVARVLAPGAHVILSGLLPQQANAALAAYRSHGLVLERRITLENWSTLVLVRPRARSAKADTGFVQDRAHARHS